MADEVVAPIKGAFFSSLKRNNKQIRDDRADSIGEDAQMNFQQTIQNMEMVKRRLVRKRANMLDLSPTNADSLMLGEEFDAPRFTKDDIQIGVDLRNLDIKLEIAYVRYEELFGVPFVSSINKS